MNFRDKVWNWALNSIAVEFIWCHYAKPLLFIIIIALLGMSKEFKDMDDYIDWQAVNLQFPYIIQFHIRIEMVISLTCQFQNLLCIAVVRMIIMHPILILWNGEFSFGFGSFRWSRVENWWNIMNILSSEWFLKRILWLIYPVSVIHVKCSKIIKLHTFPE